MALYTHTEAVRLDQLELGALPEGAEWREKDVEKLVSEGLHLSAPNRVIGDPRGSTKEQGEKFYNGVLAAYIV